jgi:hypothetical protein
MSDRALLRWLWIGFGAGFTACLFFLMAIGTFW